MLLKRCYVSNFGKLQDFSYDFEEGLNILCEENGWGKSTFAAFIRAMLYGLPQSGSRTRLEEAERRRYKPWQGGEPGGYLVFEANGKTYKAERTFGTKEAEDSFRLTDLATNLESHDFSAELGKELFGLDKEAYSRTTYLSQNKISDGGMNDSIGKKLSRMAEGEEESGNFDKAYGRLDELRKKYVPDRQKEEKGYVAMLSGQIAETQTRLESCRRKEENARPWREKERAAAEKKKKYYAELQECRTALEKAAGYEAALARKRHYEELCRQEERVKQKVEAVSRRLPFGLPEEEELKQCRRETEEAAAYSGELRSYQCSEEEKRRLEQLRQNFSDGVPKTEELKEWQKREKERGEKREEVQELCRKAGAEKQAADRTGKYFLLGGVLLLAAALLLAVVLFGKNASGAEGESQSGTFGAGTEDNGKTIAEEQAPDTVFCLCAGLTAAGGICLLWFALEKRKKAGLAGEREARYVSLLEEYQEEEDTIKELLLHYGAEGALTVTEALYRLSEQLGEYQRLAEQEEKYLHCIEQREALLARSRQLLQTYGMETEDVTGGLYQLEQLQRDFLRDSEEYAEAVKKREQFEQENLPARLCELTQPAESFAALQQKERELLHQLTLLDEEEKDCRSRAEAFEEAAETGGELAETLEMLQEELTGKKREHLLVLETMKCLKEAKERFSSRYMRKLQKSFQKYVSFFGGEGLERSTGGRFGGVEADINLQVRVLAYGKGRELGYFSTGMRELIGLCMRFALVDTLFEEEEPFLILDDPFVNFDEERLQRALDFLKRAGKRYQILYLVCHGSRA